MLAAAMGVVDVAFQRHASKLGTPRDGIIPPQLRLNLNPSAVHVHSIAQPMKNSAG